MSEWKEWVCYNKYTSTGRRMTIMVRYNPDSNLLLGVSISCSKQDVFKKSIGKALCRKVLIDNDQSIKTDHYINITVKDEKEAFLVFENMQRMYCKPIKIVKRFAIYAVFNGEKYVKIGKHIEENNKLSLY